MNPFLEFLKKVNGVCAAPFDGWVPEPDPGALHPPHPQPHRRGQFNNMELVNHGEIITFSKVVLFYLA